MKWEPLNWPVRSDYKGIGFKQLENKMSREDEAFDKEFDMLQKMGRYDMVGKVGNPPQHYAQGTEPVSYIRSHGMGFLEGNIIKYITRYKMKGSPKEDLLKARAYIDLLLEDFGGAQD